MLLFWPISAAITAVLGIRADPESIVGNVLFCAFAFFLAWLYLYQKPSVVAYYRAIARQPSPEGG
jgi:hypothetical protein